MATIPKNGAELIMAVRAVYCPDERLEFLRKTLAAIHQEKARIPTPAEMIAAVEERWGETCLFLDKLKQLAATGVYVPPSEKPEVQPLEEQLLNLPPEEAMVAAAAVAPKPPTPPAVPVAGAPAAPAADPFNPNSDGESPPSAGSAPAGTKKK